MVLLLAGGTHTGKTNLAQKLLERYHWPYFSIDHLKMGLIRSGHCPLTPESPDEELTAYLWPIVREMVKTAVENGQNLIVEGCYIPFSYKEDFPPEYREQIRFLCLVFHEEYIRNRYGDILKYANVIEDRLEDGACSMEKMLEENRKNQEACLQYGCPYCLIREEYAPDWRPELP